MAGLPAPALRPTGFIDYFSHRANYLLDSDLPVPAHPAILRKFIDYFGDRANYLLDSERATLATVPTTCWTPKGPPCQLLAVPSIRNFD